VVRARREREKSGTTAAWILLQGGVGFARTLQAAVVGGEEKEWRNGERERDRYVSKSIVLQEYIMY
jgi:hypothetical protein